ncbi:MAG: hypothetical protein JKY94_10405 [Rhodobacteraceae bacterium]|nr:hypothetical protein [Paracoccaceae bacterium]
MEPKSNCDVLAARFEHKAAEGLLDVKFFVHNIDDAVSEAVCREVNRLYEAVERGEAVPLDFKDSYQA